MPRFPDYGHLRNDKLVLCAPLRLNDNRRQHSLWACAGGDWPCGVLRGRGVLQGVHLVLLRAHSVLLRGRGAWLGARPVLLCACSVLQRGRGAWLGRCGRVSP